VTNRDQEPTSQIVARSGVTLVKEGERIVAAGDSVALLHPGAAVVNYYFPVEIEIVGAAAATALAEQLCEALQRDIGSMG
jgi:hypothetical protein